MVSNICPNFMSACEALKENISPKLVKKIENKNLFHKDILAIARSVFIREEIEGIFSIEKRIRSRNADIPLEQQDLIRRICSLGQNAGARVVRREKKHKLEEDEITGPSLKKQNKVPENVAILRKSTKRKVVLVKNWGRSGNKLNYINYKY